MNKKISDFSERNSHVSQKEVSLLRGNFSFLKRKSLNKKAVASFELTLILLSIFAFTFLISDRTLIVSAAVSGPTYCCEETKPELGSGPCLNAPLSNCSTSGGLLAAPTSCEYTSYCQSGTCYNSQNGMCMQNTPKTTCEGYEGATWDPRPMDQVPQCQLGCCIIADQAAFVTLTRCKALSTQFGAGNIFRTDIANELDCIATAQAQDMGACVYEQDYERQCEFTTRAECGAAASSELDASGNVSISTERTFYKDFLCSNDDLRTTCAAATSTTCYNGDVYWVDSCGNRENVYSGTSPAQLEASQNKGKVMGPRQTPDSWEGNCDYLASPSTRCAAKDGFTIDSVTHECRDTSCTGTVLGEEVDLRNGESICLSPGASGNTFSSDDNGAPSLDDGGAKVGSRYFRGVCNDGEIVVEPCADYRNEICVQGSVAVESGDDFSSSICRVNRWEDCSMQEYKEDCENIAKRDCKWYPSFAGVLLANPDEEGKPQNDGVCVPKYAPGTNFWEEGSSDEICQLGSSSCQKTTTSGSLLGGHLNVNEALAGDDAWIEDGGEISGQPDCGTDGWANKANQVCVSLGDCGGYVNYVGDSGSGYQYTAAKYDDKNDEWNIQTEAGITDSGEDVSIGGTWLLLSLVLTGRVTAPITGNIVAGDMRTVEATVEDEDTIIIKDEDGTTRTYDRGTLGWRRRGTSYTALFTEDFGKDLNDLAESGQAGDVTLVRISRGDASGAYVRSEDTWYSSEADWAQATDPLVNLDEASQGNIVSPTGEDLSDDINEFSSNVGGNTAGISNTNGLLDDFITLLNIDPNEVDDSYSNIYGEVVENQGDYMVIDSRGIEIVRDGDTWTADGTEMQLTDERKAALEAFAKEAEAGDTLNVVTDPDGNIYLRDDDETWQQYDYNREEFNDVELTQEEQDQLTEDEGTNPEDEGTPFDGKRFLGAALTAGATAGVAYGAGKIIAQIEPWLFNDATQENSFALGIAGGAFVWSMLSEYGASPLGISPFGWGLVGMGVMMALTYANEETESYEFQCMPWQPPVGGINCEVCNDDEVPCSEYRCRSLGQTCELVNKGTGEEKCVNVDPNDATPPVIYPDEDLISEGLEYDDIVVNPPEPGFTITHDDPSDPNDDECIPAFTPIQFGITTRDAGVTDLDSQGEPAQCKIDFKSTDSFDEMMSFMGSSNYFKYSHTESFSLPNLEDIESSGFELENGNEMSFFIRCQDRSGNVNDAEFEVRFCVDETPDTTPPLIETTTIASGSCVAEGELSTDKVVFYTNEPAECKWSDDDKSFEAMQNTMVYEGSTAGSLFGHRATLTGITLDGTDYYVRCKDDYENEMTQSYQFSLRGSHKLTMRNLQPNGTEIIFGAVDPTPVELYTETSLGCNDGMATCYYALGEDNYNKDGNGYIQFFDTDNTDGVHTQKLNLGQGDHDVFVRCVDAGGNVVEENTSIMVDIDEDAPIVARVYEESGMLKLVTVRESDCRYAFDPCESWEFLEGTEMPYPSSTTHVTEWNSEETYYIKCQDEYIGAGAECSIIVKPTQEL